MCFRVYNLIKKEICSVFKAFYKSFGRWIVNCFRKQANSFKVLCPFIATMAMQWPSRGRKAWPIYRKRTSPSWLPPSRLLTVWLIGTLWVVTALVRNMSSAVHHVFIQYSVGVGYIIQAIPSLQFSTRAHATSKAHACKKSAISGTCKLEKYPHEFDAWKNKPAWAIGQWASNLLWPNRCIRFANYCACRLRVYNLVGCRRDDDITSEAVWRHTNRFGYWIW